LGFSRTLASSQNHEWETPPEFFEQVDQEFHFDLDVCASDHNTKCEIYFTPEMDGLSQCWEGMTCWMNPPYGTQIKQWVKKASEEKTLTVCLIPARVDTSWWHDYVTPKAKEVRFLRGRLRFVGSLYNAPFPAALVVFDNR
jgi:phage N-6-adenine-methyltransferase